VAVPLGIAGQAVAEDTEPADPLDACWALAESRLDVGPCLADQRQQSEAALAEIADRVMTAAADLDRITERSLAVPALEQAETAFAAYRDAQCGAVRTMAASGTGAGDFELACIVRLNRTRIDELGGMVAADEGPSRWADVIATPWRLLEFQGTAVLPGTEVTLRLATDGELTGSGGVNNYFGSYERQDDDGLSFGPIGATRMFLDDPPGRMAQEDRYFGALSVVDGYRSSEGDLELLDGAQVILRYEAAGP
jgi:heat shock protein HslJ